MGTGPSRMPLKMGRLLQQKNGSSSNIANSLGMARKPIPTSEGSSNSKAARNLRDEVTLMWLEGGIFDEII